MNDLLFDLSKHNELHTLSMKLKFAILTPRYKPEQQMGSPLLQFLQRHLSCLVQWLLHLLETPNAKKRRARIKFITRNQVIKIMMRSLQLQIWLLP